MESKSKLADISYSSIKYAQLQPRWREHADAISFHIFPIWLKKRFVPSIHVVEGGNLSRTGKELSASSNVSIMMEGFQSFTKKRGFILSGNSGS